MKAVVIAEAQEIMKTGKPKVLKFGVSNSEAWDVGLTCGGKVEIIYRKYRGKYLKDEILDIILSKKSHREKFILATEINIRKQIFINEKSEDISIKKILESAEELLDLGQSGLININKSPWFINVSLPPLRLVIVGAAHIAQPLAKIASTTGYEVTIIDPRSAFTR